MSRLRAACARAVAVAVVAITIAASPALAQTPAPEPTIDSAPQKLRFRGSGVLRGHLEDGAPGDRLTLQARKAGAHWKDLATRTVDEELEVRFKLDGLRTTTSYRLRWEDEEGETVRHSSPVVTKVLSRMSVRLPRKDVYEDGKIHVAGTLYPKVRGRSVSILRRSKDGWHKIARVRVQDGAFSTRIRAGHEGRRRIRVRFAGDSSNVAAQRHGTVDVYDRDLATWYGPGFYGNRTACGRTLARNTLGVAHRSLPCGTKVDVLYKGRTISVRVIDRGPYSSADWDLTEEAAERLRFSGTDEIGVTY